MIMAYPRGGRGGATTFSGGVTTVNCEKQVRSWRLLRSLVELLIPTCNCTFIEDQNNEIKQDNTSHRYSFSKQSSFISSPNYTTTGTIFGSRHGKVSLCIQKNPKSSTPFLLLELAIPTATLAREMKGGVLRIALECNPNGNGFEQESSSSSLLSMPLWTFYCNGRKTGFAKKKNPSKYDLEILKNMETVSVGAGVINGKELERDDDVMYLRGRFKRVHSSFDSESFHLIDPEGNIGQELSVFFLRSRP
ncbi:hypothetical protein LIER_15469 [Lithospermum erythrorhizon]|uniref:Protein MIZU-KUSSEI 1-like n=1 Tax=Lithospermum erythrorhizon TaxID=34254 RepID=A0AAV3Q744_LITER